MESTPSVSTRGILVPGAEGKLFHLARYARAADLGPFVERYWIVRWDLTGRPPYEQETLPHPTVNLVVEAGRSAVHGAAPAQDLGYFDQAHFVRDFTAQIGRSPTEYAARCVART